MRVDVVIVVWCEAIGREEFFARITDGARARFYGGSGRTALEAIAWALDEYVRRGMLGRDHVAARPASARPGDWLLTIATSSPSSSTPPPSSPVTPRPRTTRSTKARAGAAVATALSPKDEIGCFERRIPRRAEPALHGQAPPAMARRAR